MCNNCQNNNCEDCGHISLEYCTDGFCEEKLDSKCVIYKHNQEESNLTCITDISPNTSVEEILEIWDKELCGISNQFKDEKVSVNGEDKAGYLWDKIVLGDCLIKSIELEKLKIDIDYNCLCSKLSQIGCTTGEIECTPKALKPNIISNNSSYCGESSITIVASNYNGSLQWFRNGVPINNANTFSLILTEQSGTYYVKNTTTCGFENSNEINISYASDCGCTPLATTPNIIPNSGTVNVGETILLTANNCNGTLSWYNSQNQLIGTGQTKAVSAGSYYAKCTNNCNSANSNTVIINNSVNCPTVSANVTSINPSCSGNILQANGQIIVNNIVNGTLISINGGAYVALNGLGSTSNSHKFIGLNAGSYLIRIKPQNSSCSPKEFASVLTSTTCGCLPISANIPSVSNATCTNGIPNSNASLTFSNLVNVNRISYSTNCNNNTWSSGQMVTGTTHTITNLAIGTYYIKYYTSEFCASSCVTVNVFSNCCELDVDNPNVNC